MSQLRIKNLYLCIKKQLLPGEEILIEPTCRFNQQADDATTYVHI
jgi:hypothetical protein